MNQDRHPWAMFLWARRRCIEWLHDDEGKSWPDIARILSMDDEQPRLIYESAQMLRAKNMQRKGRRLNAEQVKQIRGLLESKTPHKHVAHAFGVSPATINDIAEGRTWKGR